MTSVLNAHVSEGLSILARIIARKVMSSDTESAEMIYEEDPANNHRRYSRRVMPSKQQLPAGVKN
jgi:hypothetical protein